MAAEARIWPEAERAELQVLHLEQARRAQSKFAVYFPASDLRLADGQVVHARSRYAKHLQYFAAGKTFKERLFMAANRVGKSETGAYELTCHLTGRYPVWWEGRRFEQPIEAWACGTTSETLRDIVQSKLFGSFEGVQNDRLDGTGMVPAHLVVHWTRRPHGLPGSLESVWINHVSGGRSILGLKMYEQGRKSFEGTAKHVIWNDEEPPEDCYTEMLYRTATTQGITMITFTPLQGMSAVVKGFLQPEQDEAKEFKTYVQAGWDDVPHLDETEKRALLATTPPFQREARSKGTPQLGAGAIYQIAESEIACAPFEIPAHWPRAFGLDAGGGAKPTAAVWGAHDREAQVLYLYSVYKRESPDTAVHADAIKARGAWVPGVGDVAALIVTASDAEQTMQVYRRAGIDVILPDKAVETGIQEVWNLMSGGRLKVFTSCAPWFQEFRLYHRDEKGRIVKADDHLMDATRYLVHSGLSRAKVAPVPEHHTPRPLAPPPRQGGMGWAR